METHRRLPIQARRPVVNYLQLPDEVLHIIDLFLRKPHPTAVMIAAISFRRLEGPLAEEGMYLVYGRTMKFRGCNAINFNYIMPFGECPRTQKIAKKRLRDLRKHFLRDRRVALLAPFYRLFDIPSADNV